MPEQIVFPQVVGSGWWRRSRKGGHMGRVIVGPWREDSLQYSDKTCHGWQLWAELFEGIAAGRDELSPGDAAKMAKFYRGRLAARVEKLDSAVRAAPRREWEVEREKRKAEALDKDRREAAGTSLCPLFDSEDPQADQTYWALWRGDVVTVEELVRLTPSEVLAVDYIGPKRLALVEDALASRGHRLRSEPTADTSANIERSPQCAALTDEGTRCSRPSLQGALFCDQHAMS
jgi:hypothetical protein